MSSEQFSLLFYACMLIDAIGWFGFVALPRIRKLLSCKERADGIVEDVVEIKTLKGSRFFMLLSAIRRELLLTHAKQRMQRKRFGKKESLRSFITRIPNRKMHLSKTRHGQAV